MTWARRGGLLICFLCGVVFLAALAIVAAIEQYLDELLILAKEFLDSWNKA